MCRARSKGTVDGGSENLADGLTSIFWSWCSYESGDTPMREYANVHDLLQKRRAAALASSAEGPRTMVQSLPRVWPMFLSLQ